MDEQTKPQNSEVSEVLVTEKFISTDTSQSTSNSITFTEEESGYFKRYSWWAKFFAILSYIGGGFTILIGIPYLIFFGLGLIYIALGGIQIWLGKVIWDSATSAKNASQATNSQSFKLEMLAMVKSSGLYWQVSGILFIVSLAISVVAIIAVFALFGTLLLSAGDAIQKGDPSLFENSRTFNFERNL